MEKAGTHDMARIYLELTEEVFGEKRTLLRKADAQKALGFSRRQVDRIFGGNKELTVVDIARRVSASR
jgi:hypothetical protein